MAIGTPANLGGASITVAASTGSITTGQDATAGSLIVVFVSFATIADTLSSVTDDAGNSYTVLENTAGTAVGLGIAYCENCLFLVSGSLITAHMAGNTLFTFNAQFVTGIATSGSIDTHNHTATGLAATSATTVNTGALAQSSEIIYGLVATVGSSGVFTPGGSFTALGGRASATAGTIQPAYQIVSSTSSVGWSPAWATAQNYVSDVISFKAPSSQAPLFKAQWDNPQPRRYPIENRGFIHDTDVQLIGQDKFYRGVGQAPNVFDWRVPPPAARARSLVDPQNQYARIVGQETLPKFMADLPIPAPRRYPVENKGFIKDLDIQLIGKDIVPNFNAEWRVPPPSRRHSQLADTQSPSFPALLLIGQETLPQQFGDLIIPARRLFARSLLDWTGEGIPPTPAPPPLPTLPAPPSGGIGMRRFDKKGRLRYPETPESPFVGYTTEQLQRMVALELPRLDKAEWRKEEDVHEVTLPPSVLDLLPPDFDIARARAIEVGAGLILAELRAQAAKHAEEDDLIAMLLLFS